MLKFREGDAVVAEGHRGIVKRLYHMLPADYTQPPTHARVQFPVGSPWLEDWAVFRIPELTPAPPRAAEPAPEPYPENYPPNKTY